MRHFGLKQNLRRSILLAAGSSMVLASNCFGQASAVTAHNQATGPPVYDAVSIKPASPGSRGSAMRPLPNGFVWTNMPLSLLVSSSYDLMEARISGLPEWAKSEHYDIEAKVDADTAEAWKQLAWKERYKRQLPMMQAILADRCRFKAHWETRQLPVYNLVIAKSGLKMKEAPPDGRSMESMGSGKMTVHAMGVETIVYGFSGSLGRMIVDKTGLGERNFDFELKWTPDDLKAADNAADSVPPLFTALEEQLGLKLVSSKEAMQVLVIDHIERPSPN